MEHQVQQSDQIVEVPEATQPTAPIAELGPKPRAVPPSEATTHGPERGAGPRAGKLRAIWIRVRRAERRFSASIWGDLLGAFCLILSWIMILIAGGVLYGTGY
ncbi:hypothetical protein LA6_003418 [Marinibacterium anthonyi]|nr:hypothetical protein LA6_003418 [Marinibacterium anthonyi]